MSRHVRHTIYDKIVQRVADHGWHSVRVLDDYTSYPQYWLVTLRRDPKFDVDDAKGLLRLRPCGG